MASASSSDSPFCAASVPNTRPVANRLTMTGDTAITPSRKPRREKEGFPPGTGDDDAAMSGDEVMRARRCLLVCWETTAKSTPACHGHWQTECRLGHQ